MVLALGGLSSTTAQGFRIQGQVIHISSDDSLPLSNRVVALHQITEHISGPIDSASTDRWGNYRFSTSSAEVGSELLVSVDFDGIVYFSGAIRPVLGDIATVPPILVFDTSYTQPAISLVDRHMIVRSERGQGGRQIVELVALRNAGHNTRITSDSTEPVWAGTLPPNATQLEIGESDVGAGAVYQLGGSLAVAAPIPPGEKQILISYLVPAGRRQLVIPVDQPTARMSVALEDTTAVIVGGMEPLGLEQIGDGVYVRYEAYDLAAGTPIVVQFRASFWSVELFKIVMIVFVTLALVGTLVWWTFENRATPPA